MIKHRIFTLELGVDNEDICDERINACLNDGWRIVSYLPNVTDDSNVCNEPGSVYTEVMVVLAKDDKGEAESQEEHSQYIRDCKELVGIANSIVAEHGWYMSNALKYCLEMYAGVKWSGISCLDTPYFKWEKSDVRPSDEEN